MIYIITSISIIILLIIFKKIIGIEITFTKFEKKSKIKVVNNSYLDTLKHFIDKADYDYISGKVIFFNTWAYWCSRSCIEEIPILNEIQHLHNKNEKIVFVSYFFGYKIDDTPAFIKNKILKLNYKFLRCREGLGVSLKKMLCSDTNLHHEEPVIDMGSTTFIIDPKENVLFYKNGRLTHDDLLSISSILNELKLWK